MADSKKYRIYVLLVIPAILIAYLILDDFLSDGVNDRSGNPYAYPIESLIRTNPDLLKYREVHRIKLNIPDPVGIDYYKGKVGILYEHAYQLIDTMGQELFNRLTETKNSGISFSPHGELFIASGNKVIKLGPDGKPLQSWKVQGNEPFITALAFSNDVIYVADAGQRLVRRFDLQGVEQGSFDGTGRLEGNHGFVLPSHYFDMAIDQEGELWVANTGLLAIENYTEDGRLRAFWGKPSFDEQGFSGCCNPAHFIILQDGSVVTSEKGLIRIKVHAPSGEFECLVAGPEDFDKDAAPPDLAADELGRIFVLDISRSVIRIFERKIA